MKIVDFLICDDVRHEERNKKTVVGIYNDKIIFQNIVVEWPIAFSLGIYFRITLENNDQLFDEIKVSFNPNVIKKAVGIKVDMHSRPKVPIVIGLSFIASIEGPGPLNPALKFFNQGKEVDELTPAINTSIEVMPPETNS